MPRKVCMIKHRINFRNYSKIIPTYIEHATGLWANNTHITREYKSMPSY